MFSFKFLRGKYWRAAPEKMYPFAHAHRLSAVFASRLQPQEAPQLCFSEQRFHMPRQMQHGGQDGQILNFVAYV